MKKSIFIFPILISSLLLSGCTHTPQAPDASTQVAPSGTTVTAQNMSFSPKTITVTAGETITFTNQDIDSHTLTADDKSFGTQLIGKGQSTTFTAPSAGKYSFHCSAHPTMTGTLIVQ